MTMMREKICADGDGADNEIAELPKLRRETCFIAKIPIQLINFN